MTNEFMDAITANRPTTAMALALLEIAKALNRQAVAQEKALDIAQQGIVLQMQMARSSAALELMLQGEPTFKGNS